MRSKSVFAIVLAIATLFCSTSRLRAQPQPTTDLVLNGGSMTLSGVRRYRNVCLTNGATITVGSFDGSDKTASGNLELIAGSVFIDQTSKIVARGAGYKTRKCYHGNGPNDTAGGRGGCAVRDSGGGGAHFGRGGRGTVDNPTTFDTHFEDNCDVCNGTGCSNTWDQSRTTPDPDSTPMDPLPNLQGVCTDTRSGSPADSSRADCGTNNLPMGATDANSDGCPDKTGTDTGYYCKLGPSVAGVQYWHNIYQPEFGAAGGDKGCRDGDGRSLVTGGDGGGRIVVVGLSDRNPNGGASPSPCGVAQGTVQINGTIDANGKRGCGIENDSGGGGAGGSVLIVGGNVVVGSQATVSAAGALGGDTRAGAAGQPNTEDCPAGSQTTGTCDDCGGGGGGGIVSVLSVTSSLNPGANFNVKGADGGTCDVCKGEAGGGAGELQLDGAYVGEYCDGYDNDFDGSVDEGLGTASCGLGNCKKMPEDAACTGGVPLSCMPTVDQSDPTCKAASNGARPRIAVILDTSASMLEDLSGYPTFGDGSVERPGIDTKQPALLDPDNLPNDSRLQLARESLAQVISAYPEIDFALARYHQDQALNRSCQSAKWFECQGLFATYDNPNGNTGTLSPACNVKIGPNMADTIAVNPIPGPVAGPNSPDPAIPDAAHVQCINYAGSCGGPRRGADVLSGFGTKVRDMVRWLDGKETNFSADMTPGDICQHSDGNHDCEVRGSGPTPLAGSLQAIEDYMAPIRATDPAAIGGCRDYSAILLTDGAESCNGNPVTAAQRLHSIGIDVHVVAVSVLPSEEASLNAIAAAGSGVPSKTATFVRRPEELVPALTEIIAGSIRTEKCNGNDDDCDGKTDEDFPGIGQACDDGGKGVCKRDGTIGCKDDASTECKYPGPGGMSSSEKCNQLDDDCDGKTDEGLDCDDTPCVPKGEVCNAVDDDCDGKVDESDPNQDRECGETMGICQPGRQRCVAGMLRCVGGVLPGMEICNGKDDDCDGEIDDEAPCPEGNACIEGQCRRECDPSIEFPCPVGYLCKKANNSQGFYCLPGACALCKSTEICRDDTCVDPCDGVECAENETCVVGNCRDCTQIGCTGGQICFDGECQDDACKNVTCADGELCFQGECKPLCDPTACGAGERCGSSGECERDRCARVRCDDGEVCVGGACVADSCAELTCTFGDVCVPERGCVPDPCPVTKCPGDGSCTVGDEGQPLCAAPPPPDKPAAPPKRYVSGGGSGLSTSCAVSAPRGAAGSAGAGWLLVPALIWTWRKRRRSQSSRCK